MNAQDLKNSILQLAVQGKLVEQRPEEGTAKELLAQIKAEKDRLIKDKKIKKEKPLPEITDEQKPFEIPESWEWVRFAEFGSYKKGPFGSALTKGIFVPKGKDTVKVYEQKNAIQKDEKLGEYYITKEYFESKMRGFELSAGDIIVSCAGTIGETFVMPETFERGIINQALMRMKLMPSVYVKYFLLYFDVILKETARKSSKGSAIKNIPPFDELKMYLVPLPPLAEQKRIVAKIEEILPYIEQYDKAYTKLETFNKKFPSDMKKSILQLAMQGKLVEQLPEEGTAEELYQQIVAEKARLIKEGKIKKEKPLFEITDEEIPFEIPESWKWVRLGKIGSLTRGSGIKRTETMESGYPCIRYGELYTTYKTKFDNVISFVDKALYDKSHKITKGDIAMTLTGENKTDIAMAVTYDGDKEIAMGGDMTCWSHHLMEPLYLVYLMNSPYAISCKRRLATGDIIIHISNDKLATIPLPIPPLAEQKRIVATLEQMLPYCDQLIK